MRWFWTKPLFSAWVTALIWPIDGAQIRFNGQVHVQGIYGTDKKQLDGSFWIILCEKNTLYLFFAPSRDTIQMFCSIIWISRYWKETNIGGSREWKTCRSRGIKSLRYMRNVMDGSVTNNHPGTDHTDRIGSQCKTWTNFTSKIANSNFYKLPDLGRKLVLHFL